MLNDLIGIALKENKDIKAVAARVEQFVGQCVTTCASFFPQIGAGASGGMQYVTERGFSPLPSTVINPNDVWEVFLNGSWEIDIWGKIRRSTEAARAGILSSEERRRTVILTLVAAVAGSTIDLRDADRELEISRKTTEAYKESLRIFELRFKGSWSYAISRSSKSLLEKWTTLSLTRNRQRDSSKRSAVEQRPYRSMPGWRKYVLTRATPFTWKSLTRTRACLTPDSITHRPRPPSSDHTPTFTRPWLAAGSW